MATFLAACIGFIVTLFITASPVAAQHRSDPGEPIRFRRLAEDGSIRYQTGEDTGYHRLLTRINADRPAGQQLDEAAFDAANQCRVIYVCRRSGRPLRVDRNGSCPSLNGTSRVIDYDTFCPEGVRERWTVDRRVYFSPAVPTPEPVVALPVEIPEPTPEPERLAQVEDDTPRGRTETPQTAPQQPRHPTTSAQEVHQEESTIRAVLFVLALLIVGTFAGAIITYLVMRGRRIEDPGMAHDAEQFALAKHAWKARFGSLEFNATGFALAMSGDEHRKVLEVEQGRHEQQLAQASNNAKRVEELEDELRERRTLDATLAEQLTPLAKDLEKEIRAIKAPALGDDDMGGMRSPTRKVIELEALAREKLRRILVLQVTLATALHHFCDAAKSLAVARSLGFVNLDGRSAFEKPWLTLLQTGLNLAVEAKVIRLKRDIAALTLKTMPPPPLVEQASPQGERKSLTIGPPRLGGGSGNGQSAPSAVDVGMGADPFPYPGPPKLD